MDSFIAFEARKIDVDFTFKVISKSYVIFYNLYKNVQYFNI